MKRKPIKTPSGLGYICGVCFPGNNSQEWIVQLITGEVKTFKRGECE